MGNKKPKKCLKKKGKVYNMCYHLLITALTNYYTNIHKHSTDNFYQVKKFHLSGHISVAKDRCLTHSLLQSKAIIKILLLFLPFAKIIRGNIRGKGG